MIWTAMRFGLVGISVTLLHLILGTTLMFCGLTVEVANRVAFCVAFCVGFAGHLKFSFAGHGVTTRLAFLKYGVVATLGFLANETILTLLLSVGSMQPTRALGVAIASAVVFSFVLSRAWAFQSNSYERQC